MYGGDHQNQWVLNACFVNKVEDVCDWLAIFPRIICMVICPYAKFLLVQMRKTDCTTISWKADCFSRYADFPSLILHLISTSLRCFKGCS